MRLVIFIAYCLCAAPGLTSAAGPAPTEATVRELTGRYVAQMQAGKTPEAIATATQALAEAEPLYVRSLAILQRSVPSFHPLLLDVRERYKNVLQAQGKPAPASSSPQ